LYRYNEDGETFATLLQNAETVRLMSAEFDEDKIYSDDDDDDDGARVDGGTLSLLTIVTIVHSLYICPQRSCLISYHH
jgi:hypothetical protein